MAPNEEPLEIEILEEVSNDCKDVVYYALNTGFIDKSSYRINSHAPRLLTNENNSKVITVIKEELSKCTSFSFSVAFVSSEIILDLKQDFYDFADRSNAEQSYIITSTMNTFNRPGTFEELLKLENVTNGKIKVKIFGSELNPRKARKREYHPKGYFFRHDEYSSVIIGSSNLTERAFKSNYEWNIRFSSMNDGKIVEDISDAIKQQIEGFYTIDLDQGFIDKYRHLYNEKNPKALKKLKREIAAEQKYEPNEMQIEALEALRRSREDNKPRALVVSATGTGKTILCAFDVRRFTEQYIQDKQQKPKILFIAHRKLLLVQAKQKFKEVIGNLLTYDSFSGSYTKADCIFTTNIMMSKGLREFNSNYFDYIIIDESHRSAANTYHSIIDYFSPHFFLGLTATPERADDAEVVYELFNNNVAYEIRLQQALRIGLVCPFHYYGVADLDRINALKRSDSLSFHTSEDRVNHVVQKIELYRHAQGKVKALVFCSRLDEAQSLSNSFNERGMTSAFISGKNSEEERESAIEALEQGSLEYIFTVDIFNEGVDIPCLNLVVMLRNTESSVVFIQQLGRGLRWSPDKESVVIIDFIGNYANSYMIPLALFGNKGVTKDTLRKRVFDSDDDDVDIGYSSVSFDRIAMERVFAAIDKAQLNNKIEIKKDCQRLNAMLGRKPLLNDFYLFEATDPRLILKHKDFGDLTDVWSYSLKDTPILQQSEKALLRFINKEFIEGKSYGMLIALRSLIKNHVFSYQEYTSALSEDKTGLDRQSKRAWQGLIRVLNGSFFLKEDNPSLIKETKEKVPERIQPSTLLAAALTNADFKMLIDDVVSTALKVCKQEYENSFDFVIGKYYSYKDVWQILGFPKEQVWLNVGGYETIDNITPVFIKYKKDKRTSSVRKYEDGFINQEHMIAESKSGKTISDVNVQDYIHSIRRPVFVRKSHDERNWMFVGDADVIGAAETVVEDDSGAKVNIVEFLLRFHAPVKLSIFNYFTDNGENTLKLNMIKKFKFTK